jgi:hypothetical protein
MPELQIDEAASLADRAGALYEEIRARTAELDGLKARLALLAEFKDGSKTGHLKGTCYTVTVQLKENFTFDQNGLDGVRARVGDPVFFKVFKFKFEPIMKDVKAVLEHGTWGDEIRSVMTVTEGKPYVTFKRMEDC